MFHVARRYHFLHRQRHGAFVRAQPAAVTLLRLRSQVQQRDAQGSAGLVAQNKKMGHPADMVAEGPPADDKCQ